MSKIHQTRAKSPWHLWAVGLIALLWTGMGSFDFVATVARFEPYMDQFSQELKDYWYSFPWWMFLVWGLGNFSGLAGAVLLLARNRYSVPALGISLICALISMVVALLNPGPEGAGGGVMPWVFIAIAAGLFLYAWRMRASGVLR